MARSFAMAKLPVMRALLNEKSRPRSACPADRIVWMSSACAFDHNCTLLHEGVARDVIDLSARVTVFLRARQNSARTDQFEVAKNIYIDGAAG